MSNAAETAFHFLAENSPDIICRAASDATLLYASPSTLPILGWKPEEMVGQNLDAFVPPEDASRLVASPANADSPIAPVTTVRVTRKDGSVTWMEAKCCFLEHPSEMVLSLRDVADRLQPHEGHPAETLIESAIDARTGLFTWPTFLRTLDREWSRALREHAPVSLVRLDFHRFARFHGQEEHTTDDGCFPRVATAVLETIRMADTAARYGDENIAVILPSTDADGANRVIAKLRRAVASICAQPRFMEGCMSAGLATCKAHSAGTIRIPQLLLLAAEQALQRAKRQDAGPISPHPIAVPDSQSQCA